ncbi:hypothetical protein [Weissella cibaria]|uniref:hypothetical protein n=1 Tax=Weissella cibaria TaxID=137591 RepID=UPI003D366242
MNQLMLDIPTAYEPEENHPAYQINQLVESLDFTDEYTTDDTLITHVYYLSWFFSRTLEAFDQVV